MTSERVHVDVQSVGAGIDIWFEDRGRLADPVVLLISSANATSMCWPSSLLDGLVDAGLRVIRYDNRDVGLSTWPSAQGLVYTFDDLTADAMSLIDTLEIDRCHVVGLSMGGAIAQRLALVAPLRIDRLVLVATTADLSRRVLSGCDPKLVAALEGIAHDVGPVERTVMAYRSFAGSRFAFDDDWYRRMAEEDLVRGQNPAPGHGDVMAGTAPWIDELRSVSSPTLVVHGSEDGSFPLDHGHALAHGLRDAQLVVWEGVGHEIPPALHDELTRMIIQHLG